MKRIAQRIAILAALAALALMSAAPAWAHVTVAPGELPASGYAKIDFRVPHGCEDAATNVVTVQLPDEVVSVTPQVVPGWEIETEVGPLSEPVELHGETITEGIRVVRWSGGPLDTAHLEEFGMSVRVQGEPGETLYFPTVQTCVDGSEAAWIQIPTTEGEELDYPAPAITLSEGGGGHGSDAEEADDHGDEASTDDAETVAGGEASGADGGNSGAGTSPIAWIGLVLGGIGVILGGSAFAATRRTG